MQPADKVTNGTEKFNTVCSDISQACVYQNSSGFNAVPSTSNQRQIQIFHICQKGVYLFLTAVFVQPSVHMTITSHRTFVSATAHQSQGAWGACEAPVTLPGENSNLFLLHLMLRDRREGCRQSKPLPHHYPRWGPALSDPCPTRAAWLGWNPPLSRREAQLPSGRPLS